MTATGRKPSAMMRMAGSSPCAQTMPISTMTSASASMVRIITAPKVGRDCSAVSSSTAPSSRPIIPHTAQSRCREKRAGSVTMRTNHRPTADDTPGSTKLAWKFQVSQLSHTCCAPTPR